MISVSLLSLGLFIHLCFTVLGILFFNITPNSLYCAFVSELNSVFECFKHKMLSERGSRWFSLYVKFNSYLFTIPFTQDSGSIKVRSWILVMVSKLLSLPSLFHFLYSIVHIAHLSDPLINIYNLFFSIYILSITFLDLSLSDSIFFATSGIVKVVKSLSHVSNKCKGNFQWVFTLGLCFFLLFSS